MDKRYTFTRIVTTEYIFEVEAENIDKANDKFSEMSNDEAVGHRLLDNSSDFVKEEEINEEEI